MQIKAIAFLQNFKATGEDNLFKVNTLSDIFDTNLIILLLLLITKQSQKRTQTLTSLGEKQSEQLF